MSRKILDENGDAPVAPPRGTTRCVAEWRDDLDGGTLRRLACRGMDQARRLSEDRDAGGLCRVRVERYGGARAGWVLVEQWVGGSCTYRRDAEGGFRESKLARQDDNLAT